MSFVKSATTSVPAERSKAELEKLVRRYGADGYSVAHDYTRGVAIVSFVVPDSTAKDAARVPVKLHMDVQRIYHALYGVPKKDYRNPTGKYDSALMEKAERVAWRNLILWVDAQLSAATIGLQSVTEAFYAHVVIGPSGQRAIDYVPQLMDPTRQLTAGEAP